MNDSPHDLARTVSTLGSARRINVIGTSGTGKTTFSRQLAEVLGVPCYEMDRMFWRPGWTASSDDDFFARVKEATSEETWVLDGNYNRSNPVKWARVECVVWLDYSFARTFRQAVFRALKRAAFKEELWPGTGNRESFRQSFFSKDSIILWTLKTYRSNRKRYRALMAESAGRTFDFVRIASPGDAAQLLDLLSGKN